MSNIYKLWNTMTDSFIIAPIIVLWLFMFHSSHNLVENALHCWESSTQMLAIILIFFTSFVGFQPISTSVANKWMKDWLWKMRKILEARKIKFYWLQQKQFIILGENNFFICSDYGQVTLLLHPAKFCSQQIHWRHK